MIKYYKSYLFAANLLLCLIASSQTAAQNQTLNLDIDDNPQAFEIPIPKSQTPFKQSDPAPNSYETKINVGKKIQSDDALPDAVLSLKNALIKAAKTGDVSKLRPYIEIGPEGTQLSIQSEIGDPIEYLRESSTDGEALETLAILIDLLSLPPVHVGAVSQKEAYVWPYFWGRSLSSLTNNEKVELFQILTYGDFVAMQEVDTYFFYRLAISPQGKWLFFVTGD